MLSELAVTNVGIIDDVRLVLGPGMTALTGETGAGKTMLVEALELLVGGRADPLLVRPGASEATVEGRFDDGGTEVVLTAWSARGPIAPM
ncbi:MAG: AAA family ATPase [Acidimicrobiales bacterium]